MMSMNTMDNLIVVVLLMLLLLVLLLMDVRLLESTAVEAA